MSRRTRRNKNKLFNRSNTQNTAVKKDEEKQIINTDYLSAAAGNHDIFNLVAIGGFCLALLIGLSVVINRTDWLNSLMDKFNNLF